MGCAINQVLRRGLCSSHLNGPVSSSNVRKMFLDYFEGEHDHLWVPSSPVLPDRDATLSFVNSGMTQFKDIFLGLVTPASRRVVNSQKCVRIKGKHNDLALVGLDGHHHTFFEMLGNWSFGDYFKKEACSMSWNLLTKVYNIPEDRLYVTYFKGDEALSLPPDTETRDIWAEIGVPQNRILPFGMRENFWEMGSTGPCGPCTEIHYDHFGRADASSLVNTGSPSVVEIWNLVFMEFNRKKKVLEHLGQHFVDTGMGFERLVAVLQGQVSNYETDIFRPLFDVIQRVSGHPGYNGRYDGDDEMDRAYRILADHVRMLTVALSDDMLPNMQNKIRSIFRTAWNLSNKTFKVEKGLIKELSSHVAESLSSTYPEIGRNANKVHYIIEEEEELLRKKEADVRQGWAELLKKHPHLMNAGVDAKKEFLNGYSYLAKVVMKDSNGVLSSENAWKLFDTYGVPEKDAESMAHILGLKFDFAEYESYRKSLVEKERTVNEDKFESERNLSIGAGIKPSDLGPNPTDDHFKFEYDFDSEGNCALKEIPVKILSVNVNGELAESIKSSFTYESNVAVVLDKTNCFAETREMDSDRAFLEVEGGAVLHLYRVKSEGNKIIHFVSMKKICLPIDIKVNDTGVLKPCELTRSGLMRGWTGLMLLKTILHAKLKVFVETSYKVGNDFFQIVFTSYKDKLDVKDILDLEKSVLEAAKTVTLEREILGPKEIANSENFLRRPGQTFIEPEIPVCKITGRDFTARLPCPGPILRDASGLKDFVITSYKSVGYRQKEITAMTGVQAESTRQRNNTVLEQWNHLRDFHVVQFASQEDVEERINVITQFVRRLMQYKELSHYVKECVIEETKCKLTLLQKYIKREIREERRVYEAWEKR